MPRKKGSTPAEFVTASQAIQWLAKPNRSAAKHETSWDSAQARVIRAHVNGRINLIGRKEDVTGLAGKPTPLERIPSKYFAHDVVLGDSLFARPHKKGPPVTRETWRDVKMARSEFEAEFKHTSAEAALLRWWKETTRREGRSPTERDAFLEFAQRQRPRLPRAWLTPLLKKLPKSARRKPSGRPPGPARKGRKP